MGWDGYACGPRGGELKPKVKARFRNAAEAVESSTGLVDCLLSAGALDTSSCALALDDMIGCEGWAWSDHSPDEVATAWDAARDAENSDNHETWAWASAKSFLQTAAETGCSYQASY